MPPAEGREPDTGVRAGPTSMSHSQFSSPRYKVGQRSLERPGGVTVVASFQVVKAGNLLLTGMLLRCKPELVDSSESVLYPLLYVATRGKYAALSAAMQGANLLPGLMVFLGLYLGMIGSGLWHLQNWARRSVLLTCGMTLLLWAKSTLLPGTAGVGVSSLGSARPDLQNFHILLFLDAAVFVYLIRSNTSEVFEAGA